MFVSKKNVMTSHIAMWSGPRTISTAMMRAWESRGDCVVTDEPLYAHYLDHTQIQHPGFEEVVCSQSTSWQEVTQSLCGPIPGQQPFWYQKHMTHHLLDHIDRAWMSHLRHCFLIRHPREVLASYARRRESVTVEDLGSLTAESYCSNHRSYYESCVLLWKSRLWNPCFIGSPG